MDFSVFDSTLDKALNEDKGLEYLSAIWTLRYGAFGDFELIFRKPNPIIKLGNFLQLRETPNVLMEIEVLEETKTKGGYLLKATGRTPDASILNTRGILEPNDLCDTTHTGRVITSLVRVLREVLIDDVYAQGPSSPSVALGIPDLTIVNNVSNSFNKVISDPFIVSGNQYVYDYIEDICNGYNVGFKWETSLTTLQRQLIFYNMFEPSTMLEFSVDDGSLIQSTRVTSDITFKNVSLEVLPKYGQDSNSADPNTRRVTQTIKGNIGAPRHRVHLMGNESPPSYETLPEYLAWTRERFSANWEELNKAKRTNVLSSDLAPDWHRVVTRKPELGEIVYVEKEKHYVSEYSWSHDSQNGLREWPTFTVVPEED